MSPGNYERLFRHIPIEQCYQDRLPTAFYFQTRCDAGLIVYGNEAGSIPELHFLSLSLLVVVSNRWTHED